MPLLKRPTSTSTQATVYPTTVAHAAPAMPRPMHLMNTTSRVKLVIVCVPITSAGVSESFWAKSAAYATIEMSTGSCAKTRMWR